MIFGKVCLQTESSNFTRAVKCEILSSLLIYTDGFQKRGGFIRVQMQSFIKGALLTLGSEQKQLKIKA